MLQLFISIFSIIFYNIDDPVTKNTFKEATTLPVPSPHKAALAKIDNKEKEIHQEMISLLTPAFKSQDILERSLIDLRHDHERKVEEMKQDYSKREEELAEEENLLLQELTRLKASSDDFHSELESVIENGQRNLAQFKESQEAIHAQIRYSIISTTKLIDDMFQNYLSERESIRKESDSLLKAPFLSFPFL